MRRKTRVVWTEVEKDIIAVKAAELIREDPKLPMFAAVGKAQEYFRADRQRSMINASCLGDLKPKIEKHLNMVAPSRIKVDPVMVDIRSEFARAVAMADEECLKADHYHEQCIVWRGLVTGFLAGRGK